MKLTPEQKKGLERDRTYVEAHQLVSVMNDTKWTRLWESVRDQGFKFRRKDIREPEPSHSWDSDYYIFAGWWVSIEWLEISTSYSVHQGSAIPPRQLDRSQEVEGLLRDLRIPFVRDHGRVRVHGYMRPGDSPNWVL